MNITNEKITIFTEGHGEGDKAFLGFTTTISHKNEDNTYLNYSIEVRFVGDMYAKGQKLAPDFAYKLNVEQGWLDVRAYQDKEGKIQKRLYLAIAKATTEGKGKKINKVKTLDESGLPF